MNANNTKTNSCRQKCAIAFLSLIFFAGSISIQEVKAQDVPYTGVPEADSLALVAIYYALNGDDWIQQGGWLSGVVMNWDGIRVANIGDEANPEWVVDRVRIPDGIMTVPGFLPPEIGNMKYVTEFRKRNDLVTDVIPPEISGMDALRNIGFEGNYLVGEIPWEEISQIQGGIRRIEAPSNYFTGEFPSTMPSGGFDLLERFDLRFNRFGGVLPQWLGDVTTMTNLRLGHNNIGGDLPDLSNLENLDRLEMDNMPLTPGPIWPWIQILGEKKLNTIYIMNSNRTGTVPAWWADMPILRSFGFGEDNITLEDGLGGQLPDLSALTNANTIVLQGMHWTGELPASLGDIISGPRLFMRQCSFEGDLPGNLVNIGNIWIENCPNLTGGLPEEFRQYSGSQLVINNSPNDNNDYIYWPHMPEMSEYVGQSSFDFGEFPEWLGDLGLSTLVLSNVGLTGEIPDNLNNLSLNALNLSYNPGLTGELPQWLANKELGILDVSYTGLTVPEFPAWMENNPNFAGLYLLGLSGLGMSGEIPWWIGEMRSLVGLSLADNNLTGSLPQSMGYLRRLDSLNVANNDLSGEIHSSFYNIGYLGGGFYGLESIDVSGNPNLTGTWSTQLATASEMRVFRYDGTDLVAPDDPAFETWLTETIPANSDLRYPSIYTDVRINEAKEPTNVDNINLPKRITLYQNYPNPFNPTTKIKYDLPNDVHVSLRVYNTLGQLVTTLVNGQQLAGTHTVEFDAARLASGTYIYRLQAGDRVLNHSMLLVK